MTRLIQFANNATSRLAANLSAGGLTATLIPGDGAKFPTLTGGQVFFGTLVRSDGTKEVVKVTARATDTLTIVRAVEPVGGVQTAFSFSAGDKFELRMTAGSLSSELDRLDAAAFLNTVTKNANYTITEADVCSLIKVDTGSGNITITLPQISTLTGSFEVQICKSTGDTNTVSVVRSGGDTINGLNTYALASQYQCVWLVADLTNNTWTAVTSASASNRVVNTFVGSGTAGPFTLSGDPGSKNNTDVYVGGVYQEKSTYTVSGTSLTLGGSVGVGVIAECIWTQPLPIGTPSDGTVTDAKVASDSKLYNRISNDAVSVFDYMTAAQISDVKARTLTQDVTAAIQSAFTAASGKKLHVPAGTYKITSEVTIPSNIHIFGDGKGVTILHFQKASNPVSSEFMLAARSKSNILIDFLTLTSNAYADGLFNVGTYTAGPPKKYANGTAGNINGLLISSCSDVDVDDIEVRYFNNDGIRVSVEGSTSAYYNKRLNFNRIYGHHCLVSPLDILGAMDFKVTNCTFIDNGNFTASYIDGSTGYGVVLGRVPSGTQLRSFGGLCANNFCARNARHGIDMHAGGNITITGNICEDNLVQGIGVQDVSGSADDSYVGDVIVSKNNIYHTAWVEAQYSLITYRDDGSERDDSIPIFVSRVNGSLLQNATVEGNQIRNWRYRQLTANTTSDLVGAVIVSVVNNAKVSGNVVEALNTSYMPSFGLQVECRTFDVSGNRWHAKQRSTVSKAFFVLDADNEGTVTGNHFELANVYTDSAVTQAAYPTFEKVAGQIDFTGNTIVQTPQGTRGPLIKTAFTNHYYGFNGVWANNQGNTIYLNGTTRSEYAQRIKGSLSVYISSTGSGQYDGLSSAHAYVVNSATSLLNIISDMPRCDGGLTINCVDNVSLGATGVVTIPQWQDDITFTGNNADTANSMTKTGGITTTGAGLIVCPDRSNNINFNYLYLKSAGAVVVQSPANVLYCAVEATAAAGVGVLTSYKASYVRNTRFKGPGGTSVALQATLGSRVVSQANDSDASQFAYGLNANSAAIYKNSTQPTGSTANELAQNGGTIA